MVNGVGLVRFWALFAVGVRQLVLTFGGAVGIDAFGDGVAVDAEGFGSMRNTLLMARKSPLNVELFELVEGLIQKDVAIEHVFNNGF